MRLLALLLAVTATAVPACAQTNSPTPNADRLTVNTVQGPVHGKLAEHDTRAFLGIPYAAPPVGDLRWRTPQTPLTHADTLDATHFGHHCYQFGGFADMVFQDAGPSEDCLTVNIWTPASSKPDAKLPVMVWIHGGGYTGGGSSEPRHNGSALAAHNVVIVTLNYRLGMLGFFTHPTLIAESAHHAAGNYGLLDQAAALQWVHDNIAAFGGAPDNLTIFGESAGSFSVSSLMASPLAKPLLSKAIGESGASFDNRTLPFATLNERAAHDAAFAKKVLGTDDLDKLRTIPASELVSHKELDQSQSFPPDIDGYFLTDTLPHLFARGEQAHIPLLAGWNEDEVRAPVVAHIEGSPIDALTAMVDKLFGSHADEVLKVYPHATDAEAKRSIGDLADDTFLVYSTWAWLEAQVKTGAAPVYRYRFDLAAGDSKFHPLGSGAFHSDDIEYVFGALASRPGYTVRPEDAQLSETMMRYWTNFARSGNPNGAHTHGQALPKWPRYEAATDWSVMYLDATSAAHPDDLRQRYLTLQHVYAEESAEAKPEAQPAGK
jgi:para-nitrobenzyl esterase